MELEKMENKIIKRTLHPEHSTLICASVIWKNEPKQVVDDLNPTEDGEASEEAHCASNQTQLGLHRHLAMITKIIMVTQLLESL